VGTWVKGKSVNISLGGLCIAAETLPVIGTEIMVEVYRKNEVFLKATGVVRWNRTEVSLAGEPRGFGLELTSNEMTQAKINDLIDAHTSGELDRAELEAKWAKEATSLRTVAFASVAAIAAVLFIILLVFL
jgi:hypothetical protein